jgi:hypothetical protein
VTVRPGDARGGTQDSASLTAAIAPWNPILEWVPSQNGLFVEPPQRHRNTELPGVGDGLPAWSSNSMSPVTLYGPFSVRRSLGGTPSD